MNKWRFNAIHLLGLGPSTRKITGKFVKFENSRPSKIKTVKFTLRKLQLY